MSAPKGNKYAEGNNGGRPSKLTPEVIDAAKNIINEKILFYTDEELVIAINEILPKEAQFSYITFAKWKAGDSQADSDLFKEFLYLIKKSLALEKERLLGKLETDKFGWQRYAWILERKFDEWNIRTKADVNHNVTIPTLPDIIIK